MKPLLSLLGCATFALAAPPAPPDAEEAAYPALERFVEVLETVRKRHPDADRVAYDRLINHALEGMLASLDPHSSFIHPEMAALLKEHAELNPDIPSLGLTLGLRDDGPYLAAVAPLGPAARAGLLPGSSLLRVDGEDLSEVPFSELLGRFQRAPGETTTLTVKPIESPQPKEIPLTHRVVEHRSVAEARLCEGSPSIGYVRLASFGPSCAREMEAALDELEDAGMQSLIFDLRGNGGGDLHQTVSLLGLFLPPGTTVVTTRGREGETGEPMKTPERQRRQRDYPIAVLIDRDSASASELSAGALQDLKRATVLGETSYGKGSVQNILALGGGTALRLTIATYHTPSGRTPHRTGIHPDIAVAITDEDREQFAKHCRLDSLDAAERSRIEAWRDPVLQAALDHL